MIMVVVLIYVAVFTPFQIAFMASQMSMNNISDWLFGMLRPHCAAARCTCSARAATARSR